VRGVWLVMRASIDAPRSAQQHRARGVRAYGSPFENNIVPRRPP